MKQLLSVFLIALFFCGTNAQAQTYRFQQKVHYDMDVRLDVETHQFSGKQRLTYINNSADTLTEAYYHLYFNAFRPGSMMDVRSRTILDPDGRVRDRIAHASEEEWGFLEAKSLMQNGVPVELDHQETILKVALHTPIAPGDTTVFEMEFHGQVPIQIRRSGRNSSEGVAYSMAQWYPKLSEYDHQGWHPNPYIGREFHGVWGDFDVKLTLRRDFIVGGTGYLQNPQEIGHGYEDPTLPLNVPDTPELTWHFYAPQVHDFAFGADPKYTHERHAGPNNTTVHLLYIKGPRTKTWEQLGRFTAEAIKFMNTHFGTYPYQQFSVVQGGDGGMEYPMSTLITGQRSLQSLVGVMVHELAHSWYHGVLATNESLFSWMDEGFTVYISNLTMKHLFNTQGDPQLSSYMGYLSLKYNELEEPLTTHADHYNTNSSYSTSSYSMGAMFLHQLSYIVGEEALKRSLYRYFEDWKFRHPTADDFIRVVEKESKMILDWYLEYWITSTKNIDYAISSVKQMPEGTRVRLRREGSFIMPVDLRAEFEDGSTKNFTIPLVLMRKAKDKDRFLGEFEALKAWPWVEREYELLLPSDKKLTKLVIDPSLRMADLNRLNNTYPFPKRRAFMEPNVPSWDSYAYHWRPAAWYGEQSGLRIGFTSQGSYIFNQHRVNAELFLTTGNLNAYDVAQTDVDYRFIHETKVSGLGKATFVQTEATRYYGVFHNSISLRKQLGEYGLRTRPVRTLSATIVHQARTADRSLPFFDATWQRGDLFAFRSTYERGDSRNHGYRFDMMLGSFDSRFAANTLGFSGNRTIVSTPKYSTRIGATVGTGSQSLPIQYRSTVGTPTPEHAWRNPTYYAVANIHPDLINNAYLVGAGENPLMGYGLVGIDSPDIYGNNYFSLSLWNRWTPFAKPNLRPLAFEWFGGVGKSWDGHFITDNPLYSSALTGANNKTLLASAGVGLSYDVSRVQKLLKWTAQSRFLQNLQLSARMPVYLNGIQGNELAPRLVIGVSERF